jgi:hypothetical protein
LPDTLYRAAKDLAAREERSLADIMRRGLESILARHPEPPIPPPAWRMPAPRNMNGDAFFDNPDWRYEANQPNAAGEKRGVYETTKKKRRS